MIQICFSKIQSKKYWEIRLGVQTEKKTRNYLMQRQNGCVLYFQSSGKVMLYFNERFNQEFGVDIIDYEI